MVEINKATTKNQSFPNNYSNELLILDKGEGVYLFDKSGKKYLDFGSGIAVNALGYGNKKISEIAGKQMDKLIHVSNLYTTEPALEFASKLTDGTRFSAVHFGNSGSEANEAAIKYAKLYSLRTKGAGNYKILSFSGAFHGRTMGALSCTHNSKYRKPFEPLIPGNEVLKYNDAGLLKEILDGSFAAVIVEVVQGEGGLFCMTEEFASTLRELCTKYRIILIADEIQTALGRTGSIFASNEISLEADIITLSKPLAGGLPLSATLIPQYVNDHIKKGEHGTTFGGGPVTTAVASYIWDQINKKDFLEKVNYRASYLQNHLKGLITDYPFVNEIRGKGLLLGLEIEESKYIDVSKIIEKSQIKGLLLLKTGINVLRFAPPLIISEKEMDEGIGILRSVFEEFR